jgi:transcriptional regulator of arginine metabolism
MDKRRRREIIRELISEVHPGSQRELVEELAARGVDVDQSTVSRDLREMGVVRFPGPGGGRVYGFPGETSGAAAIGDELSRGMREFVIGVERSANLLILRTAPGNAQAIAAIMDRSRREEVAGTVAGDDTVLVVIRENYPPADLMRELRSMARLR